MGRKIGGGKGGLLAGKRQPHEPARAVEACNTWLTLGINRTYKAAQAACGVPYDTLMQYQRRYHWRDRAREYDAKILRKRAERRERVMLQGLAVPAVRVSKLKRITASLLTELERGALWLERHRTVGADKRVIIEHQYNAALIDNLRGLLADLAAETGGRNPVKQVEFKGLAFLLSASFDKFPDINNAVYLDANNDTDIHTDKRSEQ